MVITRVELVGRSFPVSRRRDSDRINLGNYYGVDTHVVLLGWDVGLRPWLPVTLQGESEVKSEPGSACPCRLE